MGYIKHNAAIVTNWDEKKLIKAHSKAKEIFKDKFSDDVMIEAGDNLVSDIIYGIANSQASFFIAPDGSKEGWNTSTKADEARSEFFDWIVSSHNLSDYIEVRFGGDDDNEYITRSLDVDLNKAKQY